MPTLYRRNRSRLPKSESDNCLFYKNDYRVSKYFFIKGFRKLIIINKKNKTTRNHRDHNVKKNNPFENKDNSIKSESEPEPKP